MARYSRVALYHKVQNAAHNQTNKLKPSPFKKATVQIPEAKNIADPLIPIHQEKSTTAPLFVPEVKVGGKENGKEKKSRSVARPKKMLKKAAPGYKIKNAMVSKKASASKKTQAAAKTASKKMTKKVAARPKSSVNSSKRMASKPKVAKKMTTKKAAPKKMGARKPVKKTASKPAAKKVQRKSK